MAPVRPALPTLAVLLAAGPASAQRLPGPLRKAELSALAARIDRASVRVRTTLAPPPGAWSPAPLRVEGVAVLLVRGDAQALVTALPAVAGATRIRLERADGRRSAAGIGVVDAEHGLTTLVPRDARFFSGLRPLLPAPRRPVRLAGGPTPLATTHDRLPYVYMRRRLELPPGATLLPEGVSPLLVAFPYGPGLEAEAFFVRLGFVPLPGEAVVDREGHLVAVGHGPSVLDGGGAGLAVPWRFTNDFLEQVLGWPPAEDRP